MNFKYIKQVMILLCACLFMACGDGDSTNGTKITPIKIVQSFLKGAGEEGLSKRNTVIRTETEWEKLINKLNTRNNESNNFAIKDIDFSSYMLIFVISNVKGNGGWTIDITDITEEADRIVVTVSNLETGNITTAMTQPFEIVMIPKSEKEIIFNDLTSSTADLNI